VDAQRVSRLNEIGMVRLVSLLGNSLAAVCVLATVVGGCISPSATGRRDGIASGSSSADQSDSSAPRFAQGGPDAEDYGASNSYPSGDRSTFFRIPFLVGSHSHLDQIFEGRLIRRATTPSRLERVNSEPALRYAAQLVNRDARIFTCVDSGETSDAEVQAYIETSNDVQAFELALHAAAAPVTAV